MSQTADKISIVFRADEDQALFQRLRARVADERGVDPTDLPNTDVLRHVARNYLLAGDVYALDDDKRLEDVRELVARDHNMEPEAVTSKAALLQACAGYAGYQRVDDWLEA